MIGIYQHCDSFRFHLHKVKMFKRKYIYLRDDRAHSTEFIQISLKTGFQALVLTCYFTIRFKKTVLAMEFNKVYGTTEKLIFGSGTTLTVLPKDKTPKKPSLSVFTPPKEGAPAACVATGFFPKDIDISMKVGAGDPEITASKDKAVLSLTDKTYNFAAFLTVDKGNNQEVTCEAKGQTAESSKNEQSAVEPGPTASALNCERNGTSTDQKGVTIESIHLNFKSLTLQGLRVMFVKTVAFNFLMTVRALMF